MEINNKTEFFNNATKPIEPHEICKYLGLKDLPGEIWVDIHGYEGFYQVSSMGRIKALERLTKTRSGERSVKNNETIRRLVKTFKGYYQVILHKDGKKKHFAIHRLVGSYFVPNPENKKEINHKKGLKWDNRATEIEWSTTSENCLHAHRLMLRKAAKGEKHGHAKLNEPQVIEIIRLVKNGVDVKTICNTYGISSTSVRSISNRKTWKHLN